MNSRSLRGDLLMLLAAVLWGGAFVAQRAAMQHLGPMAYNGTRFALGTVALLPVVAYLLRRQMKGSRAGQAGSPHHNLQAGDPRREMVRSLRFHLLGGGAAGLVLFVGVSLQQAGMVHTTAAKAGFITGLYVPLVPLFGLFVGQRTSVATWAGAAIAVVGLYFLSITESFQIERGDGLVMMCAAAWAVQVVLIGKIAPQADPLQLAVVQFAVVAIASLLTAVFTEEISIEGLRAGTWMIAYGGLISVAVAFTLQVVGQRTSPPAHAALILSLETVFAGIAGYLILGERFGARELLGAALMFGGMLVSQMHMVFSGPAERRREAAALSSATTG